ncbi:unnamed protein product [Umbelopsis ramanniana]
MVYICPIISDDAIDGCVCMWMDGLMDMTEDGCRQDEYGFAFTIQNAINMVMATHTKHSRTYRIIKTTILLYSRIVTTLTFEIATNIYGFARILKKCG